MTRSAQQQCKQATVSCSTSLYKVAATAQHCTVSAGQMSTGLTVPYECRCKTLNHTEMSLLMRTIRPNLLYLDDR